MNPQSVNTNQSTQPEGAMQPPQQTPQEVQQATPQAQQTDPGKTMSIVSLVLGFFIPFIGLILAIVAKSKSKKAGFKNTVAVVSIVLNILWMVMAGLLVLLVMASFSSVQDAALDVEAKSDISIISAELDNYYAINGVYPKDLETLQSNSVSVDEEVFIPPSSAYSYDYEVSPLGCVTDCSEYVISSSLSPGTIYIQRSKN